LKFLVKHIGIKHIGIKQIGLFIRVIVE